MGEISFPRRLNLLFFYAKVCFPAPRKPFLSSGCPKLTPSATPTGTPDSSPITVRIFTFMTWIKNRYPDWERLDLLIRLKMLSGCRTLDIVQLRTDQLRDGEVVFDACQTKTRQSRMVPLPQEMFERLVANAGKTFLWELWVEDCRSFRPAKNRVPEKFSLTNVYFVLANIFREFSDEHPHLVRLTPHSLRRRAITLVVLACNGNLHLGAQTMGISEPTANRYYVDAKVAFNTHEVFRLATKLLLPKALESGAESPAKIVSPSHTIGEQTGFSGHAETQDDVSKP